MSSENEHAIFEMQSRICKAIANPKRLEILHLLETGEKTVTELANKTKLKQANVSQHLSIMRSIRLIKERRDGNRVFYSLANMKIAKACNLMRTIMTEQLLEEVRATSSG